MSTKIFVNLPVKDLDRSKAFFGALGYSFNPQFTDENAASMVIADDIFAMLLVEPFFQGFTPKPIVDATSATEVLIALSAESREEVDALVDKAVAAGPSTTPNRRITASCTSAVFRTSTGTCGRSSGWIPLRCRVSTA
ncbi:MAG: Glyoxalase-like domain protein [Microbacteriaceae bacterium]|nr:Glyoxalase-like domain protein [Microbacteriaceae bacterium]